MTMQAQTGLIPLNDIQTMAKAVGPLFNKKPEDMVALMLIAQAEGKHPAIAAQEYDIIQGRPAINSRSALSRFQAAGGRIQWISRRDTECEAEFEHALGGKLRVKWTIDRAQKAGLTGKDNWRKFPAQMLSARVIAEGVRAVYPACLSGFYTSDEVQDFEPSRGAVPETRDVTPDPEPAAAPSPVPTAPASSSAKPEAEDVQATPVSELATPAPKPEDSGYGAYMAARGEYIKKLADIVGVKGAPGAWTEEEKDAIQTKDLLARSKDKLDVALLDVLYLRARIGQALREAGRFASDIPQIVALGDDVEGLRAALEALEVVAAMPEPEPELF